MECLGLHNKPKAEVHPGHKLMGPKEEEEPICNVECDEFFVMNFIIFILSKLLAANHLII
jgi:hypothetical protein